MKHIPRIYQPQTLQAGEPITLDERASHHLGTVLRARVDDEVFVFNGTDEFAGRLMSIKKNQLAVLLGEKIRRHTESPLKIILGQALLSHEKMDFVIQKAVELGVAEIVPLYTDYAKVKKFDLKRAEKRLMHWQHIIIHAVEQSNRTHIPTIRAPVPYAGWVEKIEAEAKFILHPAEAPSFRLAKKSLTTLALIVGPEGGFSAAEVIFAELKGFKSLSLGPRILRTETAPIVSLSLCQALYGDLI